MSAPKEEIKNFYKELEKFYLEEKEKISIIMGDFNAKIGCEDELGNCIGYESSGSTNRNGSKLAKFCISNDLKIANTFFKMKTEDRWTWRSPDGKTKNEIDHLLINKLNLVEKVKVIPQLPFSSDHRPVTNTIRVQDRGPRTPSRPKPTQKLGRGNLCIPISLRQEAGDFLEREVDKVNWSTISVNDMQASYDLLIKAIGDTFNLYGKPKHDFTTNDKLSASTKNLIDRRTEIRNRISLSLKEQIELTVLRKTIKKKIREDILNFETEIATEIIESTWSTRKVRKILASGTNLLSNLKNKQGRVTSDRKEMAKIVTDFYRDLYSDSRPSSEHQNQWHSKLSNTSILPPFSTSEVEKAISSLKNGKAPGPDGITNEMLKTFSATIAHPLTQIFNCSLSSGTPPSQWCHSEIILLFKKGDRAEVSNYRPISLSSTVCKVFMSLIKKHIYKTLDAFQKVEQAGFRKNFSTMDHIHAVNQLLEKSKEFQTNRALIFIYFNKAFDSLYHKKIGEALAVQGVPKNVITLLEST